MSEGKKDEVLEGVKGRDGRLEENIKTTQPGGQTNLSHAEGTSETTLKVHEGHFADD